MNLIKKEFGRNIVFWGGGIDTHNVLNRGNKVDIEKEVKKRIKDLASGGGFIFCPVHNIQSDVPPENILLAYRLVDKYGKYPLDL